MTHVPAQPTPISWSWEQVPGLQAVPNPDDPDGPPAEQFVTVVKLSIYHVAGRGEHFFTADALERFAEQARGEAFKARTGITTATELPPGNGGRPR